MIEYPDVTLIMTTYFITAERMWNAHDVLLSWGSYFEYKGNLRLHIADDGSTINWEPLTCLGGGKITRTRQERGGYGASLNAGLNEAFKVSNLVYLSPDDWAVTQKLDFTPWVEALIENESIGCIRLGPPHPHLTGRVETISNNWQGWGLRLNRGGYAYGDRPALFHKRFFDAYGYFEEGINALECVRLYDEKVARLPGPDIVLALEHKFTHLDSPSLSSLEPK